MGKYKFRLSVMILNALFYKLKDMSSNRSKKKLKSTTIPTQKPHVSQPFYFTEFNPDSTKLHGFHNQPFNQNFSGTHFMEPTRKSSKRRSRRKTIYRPSPRAVINSVSAACTCRVSPSSVGTLPHSPNSSFSSIEYSLRTKAYDTLSGVEGANAFSFDSFDDLTSLSSSCKCTRSSNNDIIIDINDELVGRKTEKLHGFGWMRKLDQLSPILRKPMRLKQKASDGTKLRSSSKWTEIKVNQSLFVKTVKEENIKNVEKQKISSVFQKSFVSPISVKLRANSPRRIQARARRNVPSGIGLKSKNSCLLESVAMVKTSQNPREDFRESMLEMIIENNIRSSKDLEVLLACYLILNSDEYHNLIIKTFEHIWFDMAELRI